MAKKFYAVRKGANPGIYTDWESCKNAVTGYSNAEYKGFNSLEDAKTYLYGNNEKNSVDDNTCIAYVDGSFNSSANEYGYGIVLLYKDKCDEFYGGDSDAEMATMRNVAGEILGTQKAIELAIQMGFARIKIFYDYAGIEKWATKEWKRNKPWTIAYSDFIDNASSKINIEFEKVKAHTGNKYNELADKLAKKGAKIE